MSKKTDASSDTISFSHHADPLQVGIAYGELRCAVLGLMGADMPADPDEWHRLFREYGHTRSPGAAYAHAIAAGMLVPKGEELHLSQQMVKHLAKTL